MKRSFPFLVGAGALLLGLLAALPVLPTVREHGLDWPIRFESELASLSTYGKWWVRGSGRYLADGFTGEFATYYNPLSDTLLNALAAGMGRPPMAVQAAVWGPLLAALFFALNSAALFALTRDRWVALGASLLLSLGTGSGLPRLLGVSFEEEMLLHVPFLTVCLGTAQSLGWVLFLPSLALLPLAHRSPRTAPTVAFGVVTGLLFHAHTLTFVNAAAAQIAYLVLFNATAHPRDSRRRIYWLALLLLGGGFLLRAWLYPPVTLASLVVLGGLTLLATVLVDPARGFFVRGYGTAAVVAAPYLLALGRGSVGLAGPAPGDTTFVSPGLILAFFAVYVAAAALAFRHVDREVLCWAGALLLATLLLALNHLWNWGNHPYRFAINLIFPLSVLAALGIRHGPRIPAFALGACLTWLLFGNVRLLLAGQSLYGHLVIGDPDTAVLLRAVRSETAAARPGTRLLNAPTHAYPKGVHQNAVLFNFSEIPGFVPDYRYLLDNERYFNRLGLFCFLFPGYPAHDLHLKRDACTESLDPPADLVRIYPRLKPAILPVYRLALAAAWGLPFGGFLLEAERLYGWKPVAATPRGDRRLTHLAPPVLPGVATLVSGDYDDRGFGMNFYVTTTRPHVIVLGGRDLARRAPRVRVDGVEIAASRRSPNWAVLQADLSRGRHLLELPWGEGAREPDYLYFAAVVEEGAAASYLSIGNGGGPAAVSPGEHGR